MTVDHQYNKKQITIQIGDKFGKLTAVELAQNAGDKVIEVTATSVEDSTVKATKILTVVNRPELTQAMIDVIANEKYISFEGYLNISLYPVLSSENALPEQTYSTVIKTSMCTNADGEDYWYGEYENGDTFAANSLGYIYYYGRVNNGIPEYDKAYKYFCHKNKNSASSFSAVKALCRRSFK